MYAHLTGKLQSCSAREEQPDWAACDPIYVTAVGVNVVPAKAHWIDFY